MSIPKNVNRFVQILKTLLSYDIQGNISVNFDILNIVTYNYCSCIVLQGYTHENVLQKGLLLLVYYKVTNVLTFLIHELI